MHDGVRSKVIELRKNYPEFTLSDISGEVGVSEQRVSQILKSENLPRHSTKYKPKFRACNVCGRATRNKFCSVECRRIGLIGTVLCDFCKKSLVISKKHFQYLMQSRKHFYCSNSCRHLGGQVFRA